MQFNFDIEQLKADTSIDQEVDKPRKKGAKFFNEPGTYPVKLSVSKVATKMAPNEDWFTVHFDCVHDDGRSVKYFLDVPTSRITTTRNDGKQSGASYGNMKRFLVGCGFAEVQGDLTAADVAGIIPKLFTKTEETFEGLDAEITLKWRWGTVHPVTKEGFHLLVDANGKPVDSVDKIPAQKRDDNGNVIEDGVGIPTRDAYEELKILAEAEGLKYRGFIDTEGIKLVNPIGDSIKPAAEAKKSLF